MTKSILLLGGLLLLSAMSTLRAQNPPQSAHDLVKDVVYTATDTDPLIIPEEAIVVPGSRAITHDVGKKHGLSLQAAVIVKYRDGKTDARVRLEDLLR